jgi:hypothetical protein
MNSRPSRRTIALAATALLLTSAAGVGDAALAAASGTPVTDATQAQPIIPSNSQMGRLRLPYKCSFPILGDQTVGVDMQGTFTTLLAPGQQYFFSDGKGAIEVPGNLTQLLSLIGVTKFDTTVTEFNINAQNATPTTKNALAKPLVLKDVPITPGKSSSIPIPADGSLLKIGPFTAGQSGTAALTMGSAKAQLTLKNKDGGTVLWPLDITCAAPNPDVVLAGINVGGPPTTEVSQPSNEGKYTYPHVALDHQQGSGKIPLICQFPGTIGEQTLELTFTGDAGTVYGQSEQFYLNDSSAVLRLPGDVVDKIRAQFPGSTAVKTTITKFNIDSTGASPPSVNAAAIPFVLPQQPITPGQAVNIRVPEPGKFIKAGPFTAGAPGIMKLEVGDSAGTATLLNAAGASVGNLPVTCAKRNPAVIIVPLVSVKQGNKPSGSFLFPASGPAAGGDFATLTGFDLGTTREVYFDGIDANYIAPSPNAVVVETPPHAKGKVKVTVRTLNGTFTTDYTYQ